MRVLFGVPSDRPEKINGVNQLVYEQGSDIRAFSMGSGEVVGVAATYLIRRRVINFEIEIVGKDATERFVKALFDRGLIPEGKMWQVLVLPDIPPTRP